MFEDQNDSPHPSVPLGSLTSASPDNFAVGPPPANDSPTGDFTTGVLHGEASSETTPKSEKQPWNSDSNDFLPPEPKTIEEAKIGSGEVEELILKYLHSRGAATGRQVADQILLPPPIVRDSLDVLKDGLFVTYKASAGMGDFVYQLTDDGVERALRSAKRCTYFGAAPVAFEDYVESVHQQSLTKFQPKIVDLCQAFSDLTLSAEMISQLAQAITAGQGLFLYGSPGNGKTSIAERITRAFGQMIWIPRTLSVTGEMIRLYDPSNHDIVPMDEFENLRYDRRWVCIRRPTIVVGGELTLEHLDIRFNPATGINEAPIHLKSNCGILVIDDFGRQRVSSTELLNRWIVPLDKHRDFLNLLSGRQLEVPFEQMLVLSTNLEPRDLVDEAFLRRIPYKISVPDPTEEQFRQLFCDLSQKMGLRYDESAVEYLLQKHYRGEGRPMRFCHVRDLLLQIRNLCLSHECEMEISNANFDIAVKNYFAVM